jgi:hypothetical protein
MGDARDAAVKPMGCRADSAQHIEQPVSGAAIDVSSNKQE